MTSDPKLVSLATAVPPYPLAQTDIAAFARNVFSRRR